MGTLARWRKGQGLGTAMGDASRSEPRAALELRVHGVHGTSPASMLGVKDPRQVAGDGVTGVFRADEHLPRRALRPEHAVEAYSWGELTSAVRGVLGWVQRVLWLGLLPFALVNLAYWARLHVGVDSRFGHWGAAVIRWAALLLTMLMVLTSCLISFDLVAWQCYRGGTKSCDVLPGLLDFMMFLAPSQRLAVASVGPLAVIGLLWFLSRQTVQRYETPYSSDGEEEDEKKPQFADLLLRDTRFWSSRRRTIRLQRLHLACALATMTMYVAMQESRLNGDPNPWTICALAVLMASFVATARLHPQDLEYRGTWDGAASRSDSWARWLLRLSSVIAITQLARLASPAMAEQSREWDFVLAWYGNNLWFIGVFVAIATVNLAVFIAGRMSPLPSMLTIVNFVFGVSSAAFLSLVPDRYTSATQVQQVLGGALVFTAIFYLWMLVWQMRQARTDKKSRDKAWYGAAPAVLIGAAGWIALLFTTTAVTAAAEYLNGPDQSVSDLISDSARVKEVLAPTYVTDDGSRLVARLSKGVEVRDGIVVMPASRDDPAQLVRGTVEVDSAEVDDGGPIEAMRDIVIYQGTLSLEDAMVRLVDTCRVASPARPPPRCYPDTPGFAPVANVTVAAEALIVVDGGRVRLSVAEPPTTPLVVPQVLIWAPVVQVLWAVLAGLITGLCFVRLRRRISPQIVQLVRQDRVPRQSQVDVIAMRLRAAYAHRAERLIELLGGMTVVCVLLLVCLSATGLPPYTVVSAIFPDPGNDLPHLLVSMSLYGVLGLSLGFVLLGSYVRRSEATRKAVGILWDLTTFWPRAAHPLSPPCYAERVVPELTTRIRWALSKHGTVVVSGHSQGSLIAAATLMRLEPKELRRVKFVTYGSQLRALYGRIFPRVLGPAVLGNAATDGSPTFGDAFPDLPREGPQPEVRPPSTGTLWDLLGEDGWRNLYRRADPLGWRVFSDWDTQYDVCTSEVSPLAAGDPGPTVFTHGGYQHTIEYRTIVGGWLGETVVDDNAWTIAQVQPLPER